MQLLLQQIPIDPTLQNLERFNVELDGSSIQILSPEGEQVHELTFASRRHLIAFLLMTMFKLLPRATFQSKLWVLNVFRTQACTDNGPGDIPESDFPLSPDYIWREYK